MVEVLCRALCYALVYSVLYLPVAAADLFDDIGFSALNSLIGESLPQGAISVVDQVEANVAAAGETPIYLANPTLPSFPATSIIDQSGINSQVFSGHANAVAQRIAGIPNSLLPALAQIDGYDANDWINSILRPSSPLPPATGTGNMANHSWVGSADTNANNIEILQRMDWLIAQDDYFQAVGASNVSQILFAYAMNVVVVKNTGADLPMTTNELDPVYRAGRPAIHLVAPQSSPSNATGTISSAAVLLRELAHPLVVKPIALKAIMMAGADRKTSNSQAGDIVDYGAQLASNGLDYRYGAGQVNVFNSHSIIASGLQPRISQGGQNISATGFDYVENFGSTGETSVYPFITSGNAEMIAISLVWNLNVTSIGATFSPATALYDLSLSLYDVTGGQSVLVAESDSKIDNTENIFAALAPFRRYEIRVSHGQNSSFSWPYALAWRQVISNEHLDGVQIPILPNVWLIGAILLLIRIAMTAIKRYLT